MSIRITCLYLMVFALAAYAWKDWFVSLCGLIFMMGVMEHPDMPKNIMGIQGLNPWNVLMFIITVSYLIHRKREGLVWDMPRHINILMLLYLGVILFGFARLLLDQGNLDDYSYKDMVSEELINTIKWIIPALLLFNGCRTRFRLMLAVGSILAVYLLFAVQVIRIIPADSILQGGLSMSTRLKMDRRMGYNASDMSTMLAGASWAMVAALPLLQRRWQKLTLLAAAGVVLFAQALTGGRVGYVAWAVVGLTLCLFRRPKYLLLAPVLPIVLYFAFPGAAQRMLTGFDETDVTGETVINEYKVTSGRTTVWPHVVDKIAESPLIGYGRLAMIRTGLFDYIARTYGSDGFRHPHNAYLECLLDNGLVGFAIIVPFYFLCAWYALQLLRNGRNRIYTAVGGIAFSLIFAEMVAAVGSQHFYPREGTVGMWAAVFLMLRVHLEYRRDRLRATLPATSARTHPTRQAQRPLPVAAGQRTMRP